MADGDEIHPGLPRRYLSTYQDLCGPDFDAEDTSHELARALRKDIGMYGNSPVAFICDAVDNILRGLPAEPMLRELVDYGSLQQQLDQLARYHRGGEQGMDLAKRAVQQALEGYRADGRELCTRDVIEGYFHNISQARFAARVPLTSEHLNGLSERDVANRVSSLQPFVDLEIRQLAKSLDGHRDVGKKISRRRYRRGLGLHDEVL